MELSAAESPLKSGFLGLVGVQITSRGDGTSGMRLLAGPEHLNPRGACHGGVLYTLADTGMGVATSSRLAAGEACATIEIKMVYIASAREGELLCESTVIHKGRTTAVLESAITQDGRLVAKALGTFAILGPREP